MLNGCHNRKPFQKSYEGQFGWTPVEQVHGMRVRVPVVERVPHRMTTACQYSLLTRDDPGCVGCTRKRTDFAPPDAPGPATSAARMTPPRRER